MRWASLLVRDTVTAVGKMATICFVHYFIHSIKVWCSQGWKQDGERGFGQYNAERKMSAMVAESEPWNELPAESLWTRWDHLQKGKGRSRLPHTIKGPFYYISTLTWLRIDNWPMNTIQATNHWRRVGSLNNDLNSWQRVSSPTVGDAWGSWWCSKTRTLSCETFLSV